MPASGYFVMNDRGAFVGPEEDCGVGSTMNVRGLGEIPGIRQPERRNQTNTISATIASGTGFQIEFQTQRAIEAEGFFGGRPFAGSGIFGVDANSWARAHTPLHSRPGCATNLKR